MERDVRFPREAAMWVKRWVATGLAATGLAALVVPLLMIIGASPAFACSCALMSEQEHYERADVVFSGKLTGREEPPRPWVSSMDPATLTFEVSKVYKGGAGEQQEVTTPMSGASCGLEIQGAGPYLVFTNEGRDGDCLTASLCGGTRLLAEAEPAFGPGSPPASTSGEGEPSASASTPAGVWAGAAAGAIVLIGAAGWFLRSKRSGR